LSGPGTEGLEMVIINAKSKFIGEIGGGVNAARRIGKVNEITICNVNAVNVSGYFLKEGIAVDINCAPGRAVQQFKRLKKASRCSSPIRRVFIAPAIWLVLTDKCIETLNDFLHGPKASPFVFLENQNRGKPIGIAPRIPVSDTLA